MDNSHCMGSIYLVNGMAQLRRDVMSQIEIKKLTLTVTGFLRSGQIHGSCESFEKCTKLCTEDEDGVMHFIQPWNIKGWKPVEGDTFVVETTIKRLYVTKKVKREEKEKQQKRDQCDLVTLCQQIMNNKFDLF